MNATQLLKQDHETVKRLFRDLERARSSGKRKEQLFRQLRSEVETHAKVEEEIFDPAVFELAESELAALVAPAEEDHRKVKSLLVQITGLQTDDPRFDAKMGELRSCIEDHVKEEERHMFPQARATLGDRQLEDLGREIEERKTRLQQPVGQRLMRGRAGAKTGVRRKGRSAAKTRGAKRTARGTKQSARRVKGRRGTTGGGQQAKGRAGHPRSRQRRSSGR